MQLIIREWQTLQKIGIIDDPINVIWNNKYFTAGEFEFSTLKTDETLKILKLNNYVTRLDVADEICIIDTITYTKNEENENIIKVKGLFAQSLLGRRVIWDNVLINGNTITQLRALIDANAIGEITPIDEDRIICSGNTIQGMTGTHITKPANATAQLVSISGNTIIRSMIGDLPSDVAVSDNVQLTTDSAVYSFGGLYKNPYTNRIDTVELKSDRYVKKQRVMCMKDVRDWLIGSLRSTQPIMIDKSEIAIGFNVTGALDTEHLSMVSNETVILEENKLIFRNLRLPPMPDYISDVYENCIVEIPQLGINIKTNRKRASIYFYLGVPVTLTYIKFATFGRQVIIDDGDVVYWSYASDIVLDIPITYQPYGNPYDHKTFLYDIEEREVNTEYTIQSIQSNSSTYTLTDGNATTLASMFMSMTITDLTRAYLKLEPTVPTDTSTLYQILKGDNLQEFVETTLQGIGYGLNAKYNGEFIFLGFSKGVNRTRSQTGNKQIVFTRSLDNLLGYEISQSASGKYNVARCCGKNDEDVELYTVAGAGAGITRRETFIDVSDIGTYGIADYTQALQAKGELELNGFTLVIDVTIDADGFKYRQDYNLGDMVTVVIDDFSLAYNVRVLEVCETYDDNGYGITLVLGE